MLPAIAFLKAQGCDQSGRMVADYLSWSHEKWEECHDHMQWAFPTFTRSAFNPDAPVIPEDFRFDGDPDVKETIELLVFSYFESLGVDFTYDHVMGYLYSYSADGSDFDKWAYSTNHNVLRMTRVLECLGIFGMDELQEAVFNFLLFSVVPHNYGAINSKTVAFWVAAKENKLHLLR